MATAYTYNTNGHQRTYYPETDENQRLAARVLEGNASQTASKMTNMHCVICGFGISFLICNILLIQCGANGCFDKDFDKQVCNQYCPSFVPTPAIIFEIITGIGLFSACIVGYYQK